MENSRPKKTLAVRLFPLVAYILATWLTGARIMGDTLYYVDSILRVREGGQSFSFWEPLGNYSFFEFGHLLWRPAGYLIYALCEPLAHYFGGADGRVRVTLVLVWVNWLAGVSCVLLLQGLLCRLRVRGWAMVATVVGFICAYGFLNFTQSGSSYVPALAFLLLGMYLHARAGEWAGGERVWPAAVLAGLALACSAGFWFLFVWAIPAALAVPLLFYGDDRRRRVLAVATAFSCGASLFALYAAVILAGLHITDVATLKAWIASSSHGLVSNRGVPQVIFGFARSFIEMGNDNIIFKRFLLRDPYNPVSMFDLFRLSLWKLALFYLTLLAVTCALLRARGQGRRVLVLWALGCIPVLTFAMLWQGTPVERYLPLFPYLFLASAYALHLSAPARWLRPAVFAFLAASIFANVGALSLPLLKRKPEAATARTRELVPLLKPRSVVVEVSEELKDLQWEFPFHPLNRVMRVYSAVSLGAASTAGWREDFARLSLSVWNEAGDVWLSARLLQARPRAESYWVEGSDPRVKWADVHAFFAQLDQGRAIGDGDGFVLVARNPRNEQLLNALVAGAKDAGAPPGAVQSDGQR